MNKCPKCGAVSSTKEEKKKPSNHMEEEAEAKDSVLAELMETLQSSLGDKLPVSAPMEKPDKEDEEDAPSKPSGILTIEMISKNKKKR